MLVVLSKEYRSRIVGAFKTTKRRLNELHSTDTEEKVTKWNQIIRELASENQLQ